MIQLPQIDLNSILPAAVLALIAVLCIMALLLHGLLRSRIALLIAVVIGVIAAGPALANALTNIVWALVPLGVVIIAGVVAALVVLSRSPELMSLARDVMPRKAQQADPPLALPEPTSAIVINQPQEPRSATHRRTVSKTAIIDGDHWGFS